jgi:hypothetical protein
LRVGKIGSLAFAEGLALRVGAKANVPFAGWLKLFLKKCGGEKIKNIGSAMSVGLLAVRLKYDLYVGHLSKWFVHILLFNFWSTYFRTRQF